MFNLHTTPRLGLDAPLSGGGSSAQVTTSVESIADLCAVLGKTGFVVSIPRTRFNVANPLHRAVMEHTARTAQEAINRPAEGWKNGWEKFLMEPERMDGRRTVTVWSENNPNGIGYQTRVCKLHVKLDPYDGIVGFRTYIDSGIGTPAHRAILEFFDANGASIGKLEPGYETNNVALSDFSKYTTAASVRVTHGVELQANE